MSRRLLTIVSGILLLTACESYDCTLYNYVALYGTFYKDNAVVALNDTLTITACGTDVVLLNRAVNKSKIAIPLSYWQDEDSIVFSIKGEDYLLRDTIWVKKSNTVHYESPDCPTTLFHAIESIRSTHEIIRSIIITRFTVNYETTENLQIHLHSASE